VMPASCCDLVRKCVQERGFWHGICGVPLSLQTRLLCGPLAGMRRRSGRPAGVRCGDPGRQMWVDSFLLFSPCRLMWADAFHDTIRLSPLPSTSGKAGCSLPVSDLVCSIDLLIKDKNVPLL